MQPDVKDYLKLKGVNPIDYRAVISASGFCKIRDNENLKDENGLTDLCEQKEIPTLFLPHGAQIRAVHLWGDDAIVKSKSPRKVIHSDYVPSENAHEDPIFRGVDIGKLASKEYHDYDLLNVGNPYNPLLFDPNGKVVLAGHKNPNKISYLMQVHPEYVPQPGEKVNSIQLLSNFLNLIKEKR